MAKILIVEDSPAQTVLAQMALETAGYTVVTAINGYKGVLSARLEIPDLILMDLNMPEMNGLEAVRLLKNDEWTQGIPIIAVSVEAFTVSHDELESAGCEGFVAKPYSVQGLVGQVARTLA